MVTLDQVRSQIRDKARPCVAQGRYELIASPADGVASVYPLRYRNALLPSVVVYFQGDSGGTSSPPPYEAVDLADPTSGWTVALDQFGIPTVTFASPPDEATVVGVRYLVVGFSDDELTSYLSLCTQSTDLLTLKSVHAALIPVILADRDLLMLFKLNDRIDDPTEWQRTQLKVLDGLKSDLANQPGADPEGGQSWGYGGGFGW